MADVNLIAADDARARSRPDLPDGLDEADILELIELLFFAYRDFTGDPDAILAEFGFGRAHHRVVHFVGRNPGIRVTELLGILRITKQSLGRVLKQLIDQGYVEQREGTSDRRQRLLFLTPSGSELARRLAEPQIERVSRAIAAAGPDARALYRQVLYNLIDESDRSRVATLVRRPG
jgi:DNA-binding MarR family transcriptional regulator